LVNKYIIEPALSLGLLTSKVLDRGVIELIGPYGLSQSLYTASSRLASADTGSISTYGLFLVFGCFTITGLLFGHILVPDFMDYRVVIVLLSALFYIGDETQSSTPTPTIL